MADLEEKLNSILSNPEAMGQIMNIARSLGGGPTETAASSPAPSCSETDSSTSRSDSFSSLGDLEPRFLELGFKLLNAYRSDDDDRAALLSALRPFVRPERYARLDQAIQVSKLTRVIRIALDSFRNKDGGGAHSGHVL